MSDSGTSIDIRLFNPFQLRSWGAVGSAIEFLLAGYRLNHRMHNKAWIGDGELLIGGGRNIGDAYFDASSQFNFRDLDLAGKRVFIRVDFNVPLAAGGGEITSDKRIRASLPTIRYALEKGAAVILASHLGRPKGKPNPELSLRPVSIRLAELLGRPVAMAPDCVGPAV